MKMVRRYYHHSLHWIMRGFAAMTFAAVLTACSMFGGSTATTITGQDQTAFYKAEAGYTAALVLVADYTALPRCGDGAPSVCSDQNAVDQMRKAANMADMNIQNAEDLIRNHPELDASFAMDAADKALLSLDAIMATYHVGPVPAD